MNFIEISFSGLVGALVGALATFGAAYLISRKQDSRIKDVRKIAIKALSTIGKYAKNNNTYSNAVDDFNTTLNVAEKRAVLVCLSKLGLPIFFPRGAAFDIRNVKLLERPISLDEINDMRLEIEKGHCDNLFFLDVEKYFDEDVRIKTIRNIGVKYVKEALLKGKLDTQLNIVKSPQGWEKHFTLSEGMLLLVFSDNVTRPLFYDNQTGSPIEEKISQLIIDIEIGLWDVYLQWDYKAYRNMITQTESAEIVKKVLAQNMSSQSNSLRQLSD